MIKRLSLTLSMLLIASMPFQGCSSGSLNPFSRPVSRTGTFTDMFRHAPSGEVLGVELRIAETSIGYQGVLQVGSGAGGGLSPLVVVDVYYEDEDSLSFTIPEDHAWAGRFEGTVKRDGLVGTFNLTSGDERFVVLDRARSFWD